MIMRAGVSFASSLSVTPRLWWIFVVYLCVCVFPLSISVRRNFFLFIFLLPFRSDVRLLCSIIKREPVGRAFGLAFYFVCYADGTWVAKGNKRATQAEESARKRVHSKLPNLYDGIPSTEKCVLLECNAPHAIVIYGTVFVWHTD